MTTPFLSQLRVGNGSPEAVHESVALLPSVTVTALIVAEIRAATTRRGNIIAVTRGSVVTVFNTLQN